MENNILTIQIEEDVKNYVEKLDYEYNVRKNLVSFMISTDMNIETKAFEKYQNEMMDYYSKFNFAKQEIEDTYVKPVIGDNTVNWVLDYKTNLITIEKIA